MGDVASKRALAETQVANLSAPRTLDSFGDGDGNANAVRLFLHLFQGNKFCPFLRREIVTLFRIEIMGW